MTTGQLKYRPTPSLFNPPDLSTGRLMTKFQPTVFVDRDGVINRNRAEHVLAWKDFEFLDGSIQALALLHQAGYQVIVVTNQAAVTRGLFSLQDLELIHRQMLEAIEQGGGKVKSVLFCTHLPTAGCACRKPKPGLLFQAAHTFKVDLATSWLIGDHSTDIQAAVAAGCKPLLVLTGRGQAAYKNLVLNQTQPFPDVTTLDFAATSAPLTIKANLLEAAEFILANERIMVRV
jgi:D-glycero-D-manno-heptose 1,7-bisphosphate phosphatase